MLCRVAGATLKVPAMLAAMMPEHERAMGGWHVEWDLIPHTCVLTGAALRHSLAIFDGLVVNVDAMRRNLDRTEGLILAEAVMMRLRSILAGSARMTWFTRLACWPVRKRTRSGPVY